MSKLLQSDNDELLQSSSEMSTLLQISAFPLLVLEFPRHPITKFPASVRGAALIKNKFEVLSNLDKNMKAIFLITLKLANQVRLNGKDLPEDGQFLSSRELMKALQGQHQRGTTNNIAMSGMSAFKTIGLASVGAL
ncbi:hypothetical protein HKD37_14G040473 [Glycine soja]